MERELAELRRRLTEGQEEQNLEDEMKKVDRLIMSLKCSHNRSIHGCFTINMVADALLTLDSSKRRRRMQRSCDRW